VDHGQHPRQQPICDTNLQTRLWTCLLYTILNLPLVNMQGQQAGGARQPQSGYPWIHGTWEHGGWDCITQGYAPGRAGARTMHHQVQARTPGNVCLSGLPTHLNVIGAQLHVTGNRLHLSGCTL
jgi:hypothetical protein